ncbi:MAG: DNA-directed DNA polymerase III PolC [Planctomycetota bacterium]|jgi:DNA-directed DNA polymerase III PolC
MYVPLRVHGHHSLLTGVDAPEVLLERAEQLRLTALALTDVDNNAGLVDFVKAARNSSVRAILGAEISDPEGDGRIIALVENEQGFRNLNKLISARQLGGDPGAGEVELSPEDFHLVRAAVEFQEGLIYLVDHPELCIGLMGRVPATNVFVAVSPASMRVARNAATTANPPQASEGLDAHKTPPPQIAVAAKELLGVARATGFAILAVPDVYYAGQSGASDHRVRIAIKHNALLEDLPQEWMAAEDSHLLSGREVCALYAELDDFPGPCQAPVAPPEVPAMVARTVEVAARCDYLPDLDQVRFPEVELEDGESPYSKLCELAFHGAQQRYRPLRPEVVRRLDYELSAIDKLGFSAYFILVDQIAKFARDEGIPCVGRGSAADSLVAYCLKLTDADPFKYDLIFERFLNPTRSDRPDIDLDFCWRRRDEVTEHVYKLFGAHRTAMISTLNCFGLRAAFRETALVHGFPPAVVTRWSKVLPYYAPDAAKSAFDGEVATDEGEGERRSAASCDTENTIALAFRSTPEARDFPFDDPRWRQVLRIANDLVGTPRHFGLHPGGVVVAPGPITDFAACQRAAKGMVVTQFDKNGVEAIGLVKMDLLGNRALTVLDDTLIELRAQGIEVDLETIAEDDEATGETLATGRSLACFQVESPGMRNLLQQTGARDMNAVIQAVALIRPGPASSGMKDAYVRRFRGLEAPTPPHPRLTDVLWDTQGVMLYQEDVMRVAQALAGMDLAEADLLRRALQKRRTHELEPLAKRFRDGCDEEGISPADAANVWDLVANFASFGFCKAHAVTYGRISYRAVWLKTHHPAVYMTAFINSHTGYYKQRVYVEEARRLGAVILPPDINRSRVGFSIEWIGTAPAMRIGLGGVKGLSKALLERILEQREIEGPFLSMPDFLERSRAHTDEVEHLIQCGALDSFDRTRPELLWRLHLLRSNTRRVPRELQLGGADGLNIAQLDACKATPKRRAQESVESARANSVGWRGGIGLGQAALPPGESASLFPTPQTPALVLPGLPDLSARERGALEYELMGLTVHAHPTEIFGTPSNERLQRTFPGFVPQENSPYPNDKKQRSGPVNPCSCANLRHFEAGRITLRGWLVASRRVSTSDGKWMRFLTLEDPSGLAEAVLFPDIYQRDGHRLTEFGVLCVTGVVQNQMGSCTLEVQRIW